MPTSRYSRQDDNDDYRQSDDNDNYRRSYESYRQFDDNYDNARPQRRRSERQGGRVRDVSYSELQSIRENELGSMERPRRSNRDNDQDMAMVRRSRTQDDQLYGNDPGSQASRRSGRRSRYVDDNAYDYRRSRRPDSAPDYGGGDRAGGRSGRSERGSQAGNQQVAQYQQDSQQRQQQDRKQNRQQNQNESENNGQEQDNRGFFERRFDRGSDGLITAAAGAALGAITARHFFGPKDFSKEAETREGKLSKNWKMIGGAVLGAASFNLVENELKTRFDEQEERKEDAEMGFETIGELVGAVGPDVM